MTKTKSPITIKALGLPFTLFMGTDAFVRLERVFETPISGLKDRLTSPSLDTIVSILAASLLKHHPQVEEDHSAAARFAEALRGTKPEPAVSWSAQLALASDIMDEIGLEKAADLIQKAFAASPHFTGRIVANDAPAVASVE